MLKTITKIGNSQGLILDAALCELTGLKAGDQVNVTVHAGGTVTLTPIRRVASPETVAATIGKAVKDYQRTLRKLA
jgi:antitoxin component of MazEF toxin-antitoxin module